MEDLKIDKIHRISLREWEFSLKKRANCSDMKPKLSFTYPTTIFYFFFGSFGNQFFQFQADSERNDNNNNFWKKNLKYLETVCPSIEQNQTDRKNNNRRRYGILNRCSHTISGRPSTLQIRNTFWFFIFIVVQNLSLTWKRHADNNFDENAITEREQEDLVLYWSFRISTTRTVLILTVGNLRNQHCVQKLLDHAIIPSISY